MVKADMGNFLHDGCSLVITYIIDDIHKFSILTFQLMVRLTF